MKAERTTTEATVHVCDACGKNQNEVRKMLLLPNHNLCSECIDLAKQLVEEEEDEHITTLRWLMRLGIKPKEIRKIVRQ